MAIFEGLSRFVVDAAPVAIAPLLALLGVLVTIEVSRRGRRKAARLERLDSATKDIRRYCEYLAGRIEDPAAATRLTDKIDVVQLVFGCWNLHMAIDRKKDFAVSKWAVSQLTAMAMACQNEDRSQEERYGDLLTYSNNLLVGLNEWRIGVRKRSWYVERTKNGVSVLESL